MPFGGGGGGTQTVVQNNTPFNAQELSTVQNAAIDLLHNNQLQYYPNQTYAPPSGYSTSGLTDLANNSLYGARSIGDLANINQQSALGANDSNINLTGLNRPLSQMATQNPADGYGGANALQSLFDPGGWFSNRSQNFQTQLMNATQIPSAQDLGQISNANGQFQQTADQYGQFLRDATQKTGAAQALDFISQGGYLRGQDPRYNALANSGTYGPGVNTLNSIADSTYLRGLNPYTGGLYGVANNGTAASNLASTARGDYLGNNPFLEATFNSASRPMVNAYQTAIAPNQASEMARFGRIGSGADLNGQSIGEQNLGKSLSDLAAGIYEPAYAQERSLMTNAAGQLGQLQTNALSNAGQLYNAGVSQMGQSARDANALFQSGLSSALGAQNQGIGIAANAANNFEGNQINAFNAAGQLNTAAANARTQAANSQLSNTINAFGKAGDLNQQLGNLQREAGSSAGTLGVLGQSSQISALDAAIRSQQAAINGAPTLAGMRNQDYNTAIQSGSQLQGYDQANLNDLAQRFYGEQYAPYQTLGQVAGMVGSSIPGSVSQTNPVGSSGISQVLGGLGAANSLFGGGGSGSGLLGSGGLGGLIGTPAMSLGSLFPGAAAADLAAYGAANAGIGGGSGLLGALPFLAK